MTPIERENDTWLVERAAPMPITLSTSAKNMT